VSATETLTVHRLVFRLNPYHQVESRGGQYWRALPRSSAFSRLRSIFFGRRESREKSAIRRRLADPAGAFEPRPDRCTRRRCGARPARLAPDSPDPASGRAPSGRIAGPQLGGAGFAAFRKKIDILDIIFIINICFYCIYIQKSGQCKASTARGRQIAPAPR
jgi:hypothetical protein